MMGVLLRPPLVGLSSLPQQLPLVTIPVDSVHGSLRDFRYVTKVSHGGASVGAIPRLFDSTHMLENLRGPGEPEWTLGLCTYALTLTIC